MTSAVTVTISLNISNKTLQQGNSGVDQGEIDEEPEEGITEETTGDGEPMEEPGEEIQEADPKIDK